MFNLKLLFNCLYIFSFIFFFIENTNAQEKEVFLSLKKNIVYVRQGPSLDHPIKFVYKKKYLPVMIIDTSENFKKIKDFNNNVGWVHIYLLSKKKSAINKNKNNIMYRKPTIFSNPVAKLGMGRLVLVKKCKLNWCKIKSGKYTGWVKKISLWGRI